MRIVIWACVLQVLFCRLWTDAAELKIPGAEKVGIRTYFESTVEVKGIATPFRLEISGGRLPFGLRLTANNTISGYPTAVERTTATLRAVGAGGVSVEQDIRFAVVDAGFRLLYRELPVAHVGETITVKIEGQGGVAPYSGCRIDRVRTFFNGGAAKPGAKAPSVDEAPKWLSLSDNCTLSAAPDKEAIVLLVVSAHDAAGAKASEFYALRAAANPSARGWLEQKAREYNEDYQKRFSPYGLTLEIDANGAYHAYGDSAMWTGTYLAGAAYYYAVTGEDFARANLNKALAATTQLREITGVPGLIARAYENDEWVGKRAEPNIKPDPAEHRYLVESGPWKGWRFLSTASRDQFTGVLWGNGTVFELFDDPDLRQRASANIVAMAAHVWDNKMHIMDLDGKHTRHGVMSGYSIQDSEGEKTIDPYEGPLKMPNGFNAALVLNWFNMAAAAAPDEESAKSWHSRYLSLISKKPNPAPGREFEKNYLSLLKKLYVYGEAYNNYWETAWFNLNLLFNNYFHLIRYEKNEELRERYRGVLRFLWEDKKQMSDGCEAPEARRAGREKSPHFTWQYLAAQGDREPDKIFDALSELIAFPRGPRAPFKIVEPMEIKAVPGHEDWSCEPVPIQYRIPSDFQWQRSPYSIGATWSEYDAGRNFAGVDVITPYWMGRYFGYIPGYL